MGVEKWMRVGLVSPGGGENAIKTRGFGDTGVEGFRKRLVSLREVRCSRSSQTVGLSVKLCWGLEGVWG